MLRKLLLAAAALSPTLAHAQIEQAQTVPGFADFLAVDGDAVWATNRGKVEKWSRNGKLAEVAIARPCGALTVAFGSLWVANCGDGSLVRIDLETAKITATIPTGIANQKQGELIVANGAGSIWLASKPEGAVARVDPETNTVVASIPVDPDTWYVTFGYDAVWAVSATKQTLQKIDPATNTVVARAALGTMPGFLAAGEGGVWVQEQGDGTLVRADPATGQVVGRVKVGANLKWGDIDTGGGKVWLRTTDDQVWAAIDPVTMTVAQRGGKPAGSGALRYTPKGIWTSAHDVHTLSWWPANGLATAAKP
ncbi:YncE family protein [Novosphingobium subterraneum]|uniref:Vgb family protein n=1 Tax=Novosphingobium subterraneum TaxID=48936 RepID=UPI003D058A59